MVQPLAISALGQTEEDPKVGKNIQRLSIATPIGRQNSHYLAPSRKEIFMSFLTNFSKDWGVPICYLYLKLCLSFQNHLNRTNIPPTKGCPSIWSQLNIKRLALNGLILNVNFRIKLAMKPGNLIVITKFLDFSEDNKIQLGCCTQDLNINIYVMDYFYPGWYVYVSKEVGLTRKIYVI